MKKKQIKSLGDIINDREIINALMEKFNYNNGQQNMFIRNKLSKVQMLRLYEIVLIADVIGIEPVKLFNLLLPEVPAAKNIKRITHKGAGRKINPAFAEKVRACLYDKNLNVSETALLLGTHRPTIYRYKQYLLGNSDN